VVYASIRSIEDVSATECERHLISEPVLPRSRRFCLYLGLFVDWLVWQQNYSRSYGWIIVKLLAAVAVAWWTRNNWLGFWSWS